MTSLLRWLLKRPVVVMVITVLSMIEWFLLLYHRSRWCNTAPFIPNLLLIGNLTCLFYRAWIFLTFLFFDFLSRLQQLSTSKLVFNSCCTCIVAVHTEPVSVRVLSFEEHHRELWHFVVVAPCGLRSIVDSTIYNAPEPTRGNNVE